MPSAAIAVVLAILVPAIHSVVSTRSRDSSEMTRGMRTGSRLPRRLKLPAMRSMAAASWR